MKFALHLPTVMASGALILSVGFLSLAVAAPIPPKADAGGHKRYESKPQSWRLLIGGSLNGLLTPCGCTRPMSGGIVRRAGLYGQLSKSLAPNAAQQTMILDTGDWVKSNGPQDTMKAETVAEVLSVTKPTAVHLTRALRQLGEANISNTATLSGAPWVGSNLDPVTREPFVVAGSEVASLAQESQEVTKALGVLRPDCKLIWMTEDDSEQATSLAREQPKISLIIYKSVGHPDQSPKRVNGVTLVSPGDAGKSIVALTFRESGWCGYRAIELGEDIPDNPEAKAMLDTYHQRVAKSRFFEEMPRSNTEAYGGSQSCQSCHAESFKTWSASRHSHALKSLEAQNADRDPDCVSCHVTGIQSTVGFRSRAATPDLANVGCESCHGPSRAHVINPKANHLEKVGLDKCQTCHDAENSPRFDPLKAYKTISHSGVDKADKTLQQAQINVKTTG